ncbi:MAG: hypothetical protein DMF32_00620 [Verrucomicrobia bacterium]|nr:MAG: hypothetical protein DMF32_00620 [Verrucomicrobiota bacterium]
MSVESQRFALRAPWERLHVCYRAAISAQSQQGYVLVFAAKVKVEPTGFEPEKCAKAFRDKNHL